MCSIPWKYEEVLVLFIPLTGKSHGKLVDPPGKGMHSQYILNVTNKNKYKIPGPFGKRYTMCSIP